MSEWIRKWFKKGDMDLWRQHFAYLSDVPARYLEIGVFEGRSLYWILMHLLKHPDTMAVGVDSWDVIDEMPGTPGAEIEALARKNLAKYADRVTLIKSSSAAYLAGAIGGGDSYDLVYLDGSHRAIAEWVDMGLAWQVVKGGGVMVWDGYDGKHKQMIDLFVRLFGATVLWSTSRQIAARKGLK